jgi:hypothetical protein
MQFREAFADNKPQSEEQRLIRPAQVFVKPSDGIDVSLLSDTRSVDSRLQSPVKAQLGHAAQSCPMALRNRIERRRVSRTGLL